MFWCTVMSWFSSVPRSYFTDEFFLPSSAGICGRRGVFFLRISLYILSYNFYYACMAQETSVPNLQGTLGCLACKTKDNAPLTVLHGVAWCCMVLRGVAGCCMTGNMLSMAKDCKDAEVHLNCKTIQKWKEPTTHFQRSILPWMVGSLVLGILYVGVTFDPLHSEMVIRYEWRVAQILCFTVCSTMCFAVLCRFPPISLFPRTETCRFLTWQHGCNLSTVAACSHCAWQEKTKPVRSFQELSPSCATHETYGRGSLGQQPSTDLVPSILVQASNKV